MSVIGTLFVFSLVETTIIFKAFISSIKIRHIIIVVKAFSQKDV